MIDRFISIDEAVAQTGLSASTLRRLELAGRFPKRVRLSANRVGWPQSKVNRWKQNCEDGIEQVW